MSQPLYDRIADAYAQHRRPDPRIANRIDAALGECRSIVNVGAGTGSYEPANRSLVALESSMEMIRRRPQRAQVIQGRAERLPFRDGAFDASLAILTLHHWPDPGAGLSELRRVARERVVILTWDPAQWSFWLVRDYFPQVLELDRVIFPSLAVLQKALGSIEVQQLPIPADCADGFLGAYWKRPEAYLDWSVREAISTFSRFDPTAGLARLRQDLDDGTWHHQNRELSSLPELDIGYRLVIARWA